MDNLGVLINELIKLPAETEWVEFKHNNCDPDEIGEYISALGNSATFCDRNNAYLIWGIEDNTHEIVGTNFNYRTKKIGNEELENWLHRMLSDNANFEFHDSVIGDKKLVILIICKAMYKTIRFKNAEYVRVGSYKKSLNNYPAIEVQLWEKIRCSKYEDILAKQNLPQNEVLQSLDYSTYFDMLKMPLPTDADKIMHYLIQDKIITKQDNGLYAITNMGAVLFAKRMSDFALISRKSIRVIQYNGNDRISIIREDNGNKGYASGFEGLIKYIDGLLPTSEVIKVALREVASVYPIIAIRELVANALIHQDLSISGTGPLIEIFKNRFEITNPGLPLIDIKRIIDNPPRSRNECLAALMRRLGVCEELGSGWDKIAFSCELYQLPAPKIDLYESSFKVTLYNHIPFNKMSHEDKLRACYLHACLKQISNEQMSNSSLRERFGLSESYLSSISRLIKDAVDEGLIKPVDPNTAPRHMKYKPFWA